jgi:hypothetical protein
MKGPPEQIMFFYCRGSRLNQTRICASAMDSFFRNESISLNLCIETMHMANFIKPVAIESNRCDEFACVKQTVCNRK